MKHLHVSLVGGELEPIYTVVRDISPDIVVLLHSDKTQQKAQRLKKIILDLIPDIREESIHLIHLHDTDISAMRQRILELKTLFRPDVKITINITSGLKPWAILCLQLYGDLDNVECLYRNQDNSLWNFKTDSMYLYEYKGLELDELIKLNNVEIISSNDFSGYTKEDDMCVSDIRELRRINYVAFNALTTDLYKHSNKTKSVCGSCSLEWVKDEKAYIMHMENKGRAMTKVLKSPNVRSLLLNTGWFEYEVAALLSKWEDVEQIYTNIHFAIPSDDKRNRDANETDILVKAQGKYLFVECKTQILKPTDIDKFNEVGKAYGGLASKRIFVTDAEPKADAKDKFRHKNMRHYVLSEIAKNEGTIKAFFEDLDKYINSINEK